MKKEVFDKQYIQALAAGKEAMEKESRAKTVNYDAAANRLNLDLANGVRFSVPCNLIEGLAKAAPEQIAQVELMPRGTALHWDNLDVHLSVPHLIAGIFGTKTWMAELGRHGGKIKSEKKAQTARDNGRKVGRPRREIL